MTRTDESKQGSSPACDRIRRMEQLFDHSLEVVAQLSDAIKNYAEVQEAISTLDKYYGSDEWRQDLADDEADRLPQGLKRGVLSEDGIWNLLADIRELDIQLKALLKQT